MFALIFWRASATDGRKCRDSLHRPAGNDAAFSLSFNADKTSLEAGLSFIKYTVLFVGIIWALSPVFQTLTSTFSDDTMWALTVFFSFLHVALFDYIHAPHSSKYVCRYAPLYQRSPQGWACAQVFRGNISECCHVCCCVVGIATSHKPARTGVNGAGSVTVWAVSPSSAGLQSECTAVSPPVLAPGTAELCRTSSSGTRQLAEPCLLLSIASCWCSCLTC